MALWSVSSILGGVAICFARCGNACQDCQSGTRSQALLNRPSDLRSQTHTARRHELRDDGGAGHGAPAGVLDAEGCGAVVAAERLVPRGAPETAGTRTGERILRADEDNS